MRPDMIYANVYQRRIPNEQLAFIKHNVVVMTVTKSGQIAWVTVDYEFQIDSKLAELRADVAEMDREYEEKKKLES